MPLDGTPIEQPATPTTEQQIADALAAPKSVTVDGMTTVNQSIDDIIKADEYTRRRTATAANPLGRRLKFRAPGAS